MPKYKVITTLIWQFDSNEDYETSKEAAIQQLEDLLIDQHGYEAFYAQIDLVSMKERKKVRHIKEYDLEKIFAKITNHNRKTAFRVKGKTYMVRMNSDRYVLFSKNPNCVACGLEGKRMFLDLSPGDNTPHFNLYGEENGQLILMTKDHILPKSKGGEDILSNYQTMCATCNNLKGNHDLTICDVQKLRQLYENKDKLARKDLRELINTKREELAAPMTIIIEEIL